jgi:zinc/manganese transport system ATP-binding protein
VSAALTVSGLGVTLGGRQILRGVDFEVAPGEFVGLIGSNGAGKTTLLRTILGFQAPTRGRVRVARDSIGYVPQKMLLDPDAPVRARDLVALGIDGSRLGLPLRSPAKWRQVDEMLAAVDAQAFANERVGRLSGGEQQRVLIAHALIRRPSLLLLDEPLANLDVRSAADVVALLHRLAREHRIAILLSAHDMNPLLDVMDRIVYLAEGRAAVGSVDEVVRGDVLSELYGHHVDVIRVHGRILVVVEPAEEVPEPEQHATLVPPKRH